MLPAGSAPLEGHAFVGTGFGDGGGSATPLLDHRVKGRLGSSSEDFSPTPGPRGKADCAAEHRDSATYTGLSGRGCFGAGQNCS